MAKYLTQEDLNLPLQASAYRTCPIKAEIYDSSTKTQVGTIEGIVSGTVSMDCNSDVRRTASLVIQPTLVEHIKLEEGNLLWLDKELKLFVGLWNFRTQAFTYYPMGTYVYMNTSNNYDATNNQLTVSCSDFMVRLDGTQNGQIGGASVTKFPAYLEDENGNVIEHYYIRDAVIEILKTLARITNYRVEDVGEYYAFETHNSDWKKYRQNNPQWNCIPFDQEFSCGDTVLSMINTFRDLYPSYQTYFDLETNTFIFEMIPTLYEDDIFIDDSYLQRVLISEQKSVDLSTVRNVTEVWGQSFEPDFYASEDASVTYSNNVYSMTISGYEEKYYNGDTVAVLIPTANKAGCKLNINGFGAIPIYNENNESTLEANALVANTVYCFKIKKKRVDGADVTKAYFLGQWQVHALCVLTNGKESNTIMTDSNGKKYKLYSKDYFKKWYNTEVVEMNIIPDSPFTVQKLGERVDVKTGDEYDNITSDSLAADRAHWENWKTARLTDNITITTILLPWLDVNLKVSYRPSDENVTHQYIIQSISHDFGAYTTTITMCRFYPLYEAVVGNNESMKRYTHGQLSNYENYALTSEKTS